MVLLLELVFVLSLKLPVGFVDENKDAGSTRSQVL
jgi:hypothetical protein